MINVAVYSFSLWFFLLSGLWIYVFPLSLFQLVRKKSKYQKEYHTEVDSVSNKIKDLWNPEIVVRQGVSPWHGTISTQVSRSWEHWLRLMGIGDKVRPAMFQYVETLLQLLISKESESCNRGGAMGLQCWPFKKWEGERPCRTCLTALSKMVLFFYAGTR